MTLGTYAPALLPAVVRFWNRVFAEKRNFFPVTADLFRRRVVGKRSPLDRFDPKGFIVARRDREVIGLVHAGIRTERQCRRIDPAWRGGKQGVIYFLYVEPAHRGRGVGGELWHRALEYLRGTRQVVLDGQCLNPFYGNIEGPFTPFWGTPEGVNVDWRDSATLKFLARKGYAPRFRALQLAVDLAAPGPGVEAVRRALARQGFELEVLASELPEIGPRASRRPSPPGLEFESMTAHRRGRVAGLITYYPMREVRPGLFAIYETEVLDAHRGRAVGRHLLQAALARMRELGAAQCEVLTVSDLSPAAFRFYQAAGFQQVASWAIY